MVQSWDGTTQEGRDALDIAERFYRAVSNPETWIDACANVSAKFGGSTAMLFMDRHDGILPIAFPGFSDLALRLYGEHFHRVDPWARVARRLRPQKNELSCFVGHEHVPVAEFEESEVWQDLSRPHIGAFHLLGSSFNLGDGSHVLMGLHRTRDGEPYAKHDVSRLRPLLPHLRNALFLTQRLQETESLANAGLAALEHLASGIAIVDRAREVVYVNAAMERLAGSGALRLRPDTALGRPSSRSQLSLTNSADQARLVGLVEEAAQLGAGGAIQLHFAGSDQRLILLAMPLPRALSPRPFSVGPLDAGRVLVIVRNHARPVALRNDVLKALFGLTDTEIAVAKALLGGRQAETVAAERGVSLPTIRTQVRHILEKAGVRSLRELEALLAAP